MSKLKGEYKSLALEYFKRANAFANLEFIEIKANKDAKEKLLKAKEKSKLILLDEKGEELRSRSFAEFLENAKNQSQNLSFAIGPADGWTDETRELADESFSLSKLTLAHELATLVFAEALYRSLSIVEGHPYHRD